MNDAMKKLERIGYRDWFRANVDDKKLDNHELARIISVAKDSYLVTKGDGEVFAELSGRLAYSATSVANLPTTGDWVYVDFYDDDTHAIIHDVLPRKTLIQRKRSGKTFDFQLIAANVDVAFIVQSVDNNFNLSRLERYLVMVNESNITPIILLSKCDLKSQAELDEMIDSVLQIAPDATVISFSSETDVNIDTIKGLLLSGHTYCLLGSSGVGKTTLLNHILGAERFETQSVNEKHHKGRHTTTSRELIQLENGALLIDTPGMRELGNISVDIGIDETFSEIIELSANCKFRDCNHINETGCAVLTAVKEGTLTKKRHKNYLKMKRESAFNEMSYIEKKQKDKKFSKLIKSTIKKKRR